MPLRVLVEHSWKTDVKLRPNEPSKLSDIIINIIQPSQRRVSSSEYHSGIYIGASPFAPGPGPPPLLHPSSHGWHPPKSPPIELALRKTLQDPVLMVPNTHGFVID